MQQSGQSHVTIMQALIMVVMAFLVLGPWMATNAAAKDTSEFKVCSGDVENFCKDVQPGEGRIVKCLQEHQSELSLACKTHIEETGKKMKEAHDVCKNDLEKFCKDVKPGGGRIIKCIKAHENELAPECKAKVSEAKKK